MVSDLKAFLHYFSGVGGIWVKTTGLSAETPFIFCPRSQDIMTPTWYLLYWIIAFAGSKPHNSKWCFVHVELRPAAIVWIYEVQNNTKIFINDKIIKPRSSMVASVQKTHPNYTLANGLKYKRSHAGISSVERYIVCSHSTYDVICLNTVLKTSLRIMSYTIRKLGVQLTQKLHQKWRKIQKIPDATSNRRRTCKEEGFCFISCYWKV